MSQLLYYPNSPVSLKTIAQNACTPEGNADELEQHLSQLNDCQNPESLRDHTQPLIITDSNLSNACIQTPILTPSESQNLSMMAATFGGAPVMALADLLSQTKVLDNIGNTGTFIGGSSMGTVKTADYVLSSIAKYDDALRAYQALENHGAVPATLNREAPKVKQAFNEMNHALNQKGMHLLEKHAFKTRQVRNLNGRIVTEAIPVSNNAEVQALKRFAQKARYAGRGLIVLDAGLRVNSVYQHYQTGQDWKREAVVQGSGFGAGITIASLAINAIAVTTPFGLVICIALAGATALGADTMIKKGAGWAYDRLFK